VLAHVRVVAGPTLADQDQVTGTTSIKSDPNAVCFGPARRQRNSVTLQGANALGIVKDASQTDSALLPISITDYYYSSYGSLGSAASADTGKRLLVLVREGEPHRLAVGGDQYR